MLRVALLREVYTELAAASRLTKQLVQARQQDADIVLLPELPYNHWSPATPDSRPEDAEEYRGWRARMQNEAAKAARVAVLGGVIQRLGTKRYNTALLSNSEGKTVGAYAKVHLPDEEGFYEVCHYDPGTSPPKVIELYGARIGIQICSDANRPVGSQLLGAQGVQIIFCPRATSAETWHRWRLAYRAMAMMCAAWVVSVGRPGPEHGVPLGGPSLVVDPRGEVALETENTLEVFPVDLRAVTAARLDYPGYLAWPSEVYAKGWTVLNT